MSSSNSSLVLGISVEVEMGSSLVFGFSVESGVGGVGVSLRCSCLIAVSYTHLTLPTNREV